jgi:hypothetical protein
MFVHACCSNIVFLNVDFRSLSLSPKVVEEFPDAMRQQAGKHHRPVSLAYSVARHQHH